MIVIREINASDLPDLARLFVELSGTTTEMEKMEENFRLIYANRDYIVLGAEVSGSLVGTAMGIICKDLVGSCNPFMVIENVIVSSDYRGKGIGKKIMLELERIAHSWDCFYTMFVSGKQRADAHKFYESIGYRLDVVQGFKKYL